MVPLCRLWGPGPHLPSVKTAPSLPALSFPERTRHLSKFIFPQPEPPTLKSKRFLCCKNMGVLRIPWIFLSVEVTLQLHPTAHKTSYNPSTPPDLIILQCQNSVCLQIPLQFNSESTRPRALPCSPKKGSEKRTKKKKNRALYL